MFFTPNIDPIIFSIGPISLHWYAMMYLIALGIGVLLGQYRARQPHSGWRPEQVSDMAFYLFIGAILGGRFGYALFYNFDQFIANPLTILGWNGETIEWSGMSFHGGLIGVLIVTYFLARQYQKSFWEVTDFIAPLVPLGLFFGRIGNFINGELWGKPTDQTWGFLFQYAPDFHYGIYRHPSQLYEALTEGLLLFIILWFFSRKARPRRAISGLFLIGYGGFRFLVEFFREPDAHIGYLFGDWLTQGMLLCIPMIIAGIYLIFSAYRANQNETVS